MSKNHHVLAFVNGLSAKLATRSRHVGLFLGAGSSRACGLPDLSGLEDAIRAGLDATSLAQFETQMVDRNLEQVLSRLRRIDSLLDGGSDVVDGVSATDARDLDRKICSLIVKALVVREKGLGPVLQLGSWLARADYHLPVEVFTANYDLMLETALESLGVPYFDGFVGALRARFRTDLVEAEAGMGDDSFPSFLVRLWKVHGSVHWEWTSESKAEVVRLGGAVGGEAVAAIYPSDAKYDESRRMPFVVLQDRFRRSLRQPETLMLISGYSFGDQHLNELIFDAARRHQRSEFVAFCFGDIPTELREAARNVPNLQALGRESAIIAGLEAQWDAPEEAPADIWHDGGFALGDFACLSSYLARSAPPQSEIETLLADLLDRAKSDG